MLLELSVLLDIVDELKPKVVGNNIVCNCPACGKREFGISIIKDGHAFGCYRKKKCGITGTIYNLVTYLNKEAALKVKFKKSVNAFEKLTPLNAKTEDEPINVELPTVQLPLGFKLIETHWYLESRNFANWQYGFYKPGITTVIPKYANAYILFPIYQKGEIKGWVGRNCLKPEAIEYRKSLGLEIRRYDNGGTHEYSKLLYGLDEVNDETHTVYLAEGIFSKFAADRAFKLYQSQEAKCLATFGARITNEQLYLLSQTNIKQIKLLHESDVLKQTKKTLSLLQNWYDVEVAYLPDDDPDELPEEELATIKFKTPTEYHTILPHLC